VTAIEKAKTLNNLGYRESFRSHSGPPYSELEDLG
jgi:hypothetical protein